MGTLLVRAINESFRKESLSSPQKEGLITLLPKGDKPRQFLKNWRPMTLLNVSYKNSIWLHCKQNKTGFIKYHS